jgi:hypothetical protein
LPINELIHQRHWKEIKIMQSWGGGNFHGVKISEAIRCLSFLFLVTQDAVRPSGKENISCQNQKKWREQMDRTPYLHALPWASII